MRSVIGSDAVDRAIDKSRNHRETIRLSAKRRVHLGVRVVVTDALLSEGEMVRCHLAGDVKALMLSCANHVERTRSRDMLDVQMRTQALCALDLAKQLDVAL